jgi:heme/copper-type cytochrome/quinol oxidase subunit 2
MEWYAVLFFVALGSLAYAVKGKHWLLSLFALVLFGVLAFAGFNLEIITSQGLVSYGVSSILVFLTWLFMFVSLIVLLIGVIAHLKQSAGGKHERHGRER